MEAVTPPQDVIKMHPFMYPQDIIIIASIPPPQYFIKSCNPINMQLLFLNRARGVSLLTYCSCSVILYTLIEVRTLDATCVHFLWNADLDARVFDSRAISCVQTDQSEREYGNN